MHIHENCTAQGATTQFITPNVPHKMQNGQSVSQIEKRSYPVSFDKIQRIILATFALYALANIPGVHAGGKEAVDCMAECLRDVGATTPICLLVCSVNFFF